MCLINDHDTKFLRLFKFGPGFGPGNDIIGFFRYGTADTTTGRLDQRLGLVTGKQGQRSSQHKYLARHRTRHFNTDRFIRPGDSGLLQLPDNKKFLWELNANVKPLALPLEEKYVPDPDIEALFRNAGN